MPKTDDARQPEPMTLQQRIESAMREGMLARDIRRVGTLRMAMAAFQNRRIELGRDLTDEDVIDVLSKQMKQRRESIEHFKAAGRDAMVQVEEEESAIIAGYLPQPLSEAELGELVRAAIAETGASTPADLGKVMGRVTPQTKGRADGKAVADLVRQQLGG
ncbi:MAG TPA: GatB/YqeY domain-containing protein [Candidatus Limnocylindrales bacterium]|nr:GatB/YqeY domain-containing protein [Candidatus Limnocylindrales bacterium]